MRLTAFSDYSLRVLMYLALQRGELTTIPAIAAAYDISGNHLMKVVHHLVRSGLVESVRGKGGGIRLARPAGEIRLGAVVRASEGEMPIVECLGDPADACCIARGCRLSGILLQAFDALYATLDQYTVADLVGNAPTLKRLFSTASHAGVSAS